MPRSVRLRSDVIGRVQTLVYQQFYCQKDFANELGFAQSTISKFINGNPVDRRIFQDICEKLAIEDWRAIAEKPEVGMGGQGDGGTGGRGDEERGGRGQSQPEGVLSQGLVEPIVVAASLQPAVARELLPLETPEGLVPLNSNFYVERLPQETYCKTEIAKPHALIRLKAPRQMGKTSLMLRLLRQSESQGDRTVYLSLEQVMEQAWNDADRFLRWFCASVSLKTPHKFQDRDYASLVTTVGSTMATQEYFESYLLPDLVAPLTIGLDSIDRLFDYPHLYNNFFSLLRSLHEAGKHNNVLSKLRLIISHAAEVCVPLEIDRSPFNVGISIEMGEFTPDRVALLAAKHHLNWRQTEIDKLMSVIGGHPFLVRLAMFEIASNNIDLSTLLKTATSREGIFYRHHLARIETTLNTQPDLLTAMASVIRSPEGANLAPSLKGKLEGLGLVKLQGEFVVPRCELYRQYFRSLPI